MLVPRSKPGSNSIVVHAARVGWRPGFYSIGSAKPQSGSTLALGMLPSISMGGAGIEPGVVQWFKSYFGGAFDEDAIGRIRDLTLMEGNQPENKPDLTLLLESLIATLSQLQQQKPTQDGVISAMTVKLDGKNFNIWSQMLKMKLSGKGKLGYIDGTSSQPSGNTNPKWNMEDQLVKDYIITLWIPL
ncbi:uncharacterized protein A4U43_C09F150 [Asparagus officinalis]|uniref:Retrotransposon Copia-like N-terminal domain-containing protein n=1 Tax=Asparagus officinalis TaxID=4686 RepID=A0A5P1E416_ASPOF|nr:uncharacterized protein A4U43_C09F150 [Asparagus officinalis]